ncbi:MAG: J domain-containing protein [Bdellovibrionales bacterium]|nr:J domain-containing protein [Bdellovibrionales bacterium]
MEQKIILIAIVCAFALFLTLRMRWRRQSQNKKHDLNYTKETKVVPEALYVDSTYTSSAALDGEPVYFNFNGHSWEAYETLGLTPGATLEEVKKAYQQELSMVDSSSQIFITTAYEAILSKAK